jgi:hypothetical protein
MSSDHEDDLARPYPSQNEFADMHVRLSLKNCTIESAVQFSTEKSLITTNEVDTHGIQAQ